MTRWRQTRLLPHQGGTFPSYQNGKMPSYSPPADVVAMVRAMTPEQEREAFKSRKEQPKQRPPLKVGDRVRLVSRPYVCVAVECRQFSALIAAEGNDQQTETVAYVDERITWERIPDEPKQRQPLKVGDRVRLLFRGVVGVVENVHHYWFDFCPLDGKNRETIALNSEGVYWERLPDEVTR